MKWVKVANEYVNLEELLTVKIERKQYLPNTDRVYTFIGTTSTNESITIGITSEEADALVDNMNTLCKQK